MLDFIFYWMFVLIIKIILILLYILFIVCIDIFLLYINKNVLNSKYKFKKEKILVLLNTCLNNYFIKSMVKGMIVLAVESYQ